MLIPMTMAKTKSLQSALATVDEENRQVAVPTGQKESGSVNPAYLADRESRRDDDTKFFDSFS